MQPATISQSCPFYPIALGPAVGPAGFSIHGYASQQLRVRHMGTVGSRANVKRLASCLFSARLQIAGQLCHKWLVKQTWSKQFGQVWKLRESLRWRSLPSLSLVFDPEYRIC